MVERTSKRSRSSTFVSLRSGHLSDYYTDQIDFHNHDMLQTLSKGFDRTLSTVDFQEEAEENDIHKNGYKSKLKPILSPIISPAFTEFETSAFNGFDFEAEVGNHNGKQTQTKPSEHTNSKKKYMKVVIVGDSGIGKTTLLWTYTRGKFPVGEEQSNVPKVFENFSVTVQISAAQRKLFMLFNHPHKTKEVELVLWDTLGDAQNEESKRLRPLAYSDVDLVFVCYSLNDIQSYENVKKLWLPEVQHFCTGTPIFLIGLQKDLQNSASTTSAVTQENINKIVDDGLMANENNQFKNVMKHFKCSSSNHYNINELFQISIQTILIRNQQRESVGTKSQKKQNGKATIPRPAKFRGDKSNCIIA